MEAIKTEVLGQENLTINDLWIGLVQATGSAPGRSQFYEWLKACYIHLPQRRGGVKMPQAYSPTDLERLKRFSELKAELGSLDLAQDAFRKELEENPELYGG